MKFLDNLDFLVVTGSRLYGYNNEDSDRDEIGFCITPLEFFLGRKNFKQKTPTQAELDLGNDRLIYSSSKFITLLLKSDTRCLEMLFANNENILAKNEIAQMLIDNRDLFVSKQIYHKFKGYANGEWRKVKGTQLIVKKRSKTEEEIVADIRKTFSLSKIHMDEVVYHLFAEHKKEEVKITRKLGAKRKADIAKYGYSVKNAAHVIRLLNEGIEILETGKLKFPLSLDLVSTLVDIRNGKVSLQYVEEMYELLLMRLEVANSDSKLPEKISEKEVDALQFAMHKKALKL